MRRDWRQRRGYLGDFDSGSPSNLPLTMDYKLFVSWFFISAFVCHEKITKGNRWF
jgi:hypothetical protein